MKFIGVPLAGAYVIEIQPIVDERGFFARTWCTQDRVAARVCSLTLPIDGVCGSLARSTIAGYGGS